MTIHLALSNFPSYKEKRKVIKCVYCAIFRSMMKLHDETHSGVDIARSLTISWTRIWPFLDLDM